MDCEQPAHDEQGVTPFLSNSFIDKFGLVFTQIVNMWI